MYERIDEFKTAALTCGPGYYTDESLHEDRIVAAFRIYRNASAGSKLVDFEGNPVNFGITIVGRLALEAAGGTWVSSDESFPSIDGNMAAAASLPAYKREVQKHERLGIAFRKFYETIPESARR